MFLDKSHHVQILCNFPINENQNNDIWRGIIDFLKSTTNFMDNLSFLNKLLMFLQKSQSIYLPKFPGQNFSDVMVGEFNTNSCVFRSNVAVVSSFFVLVPRKYWHFLNKTNRDRVLKI